jgi:short-subunit dehydrogenase involved in D-alanine esterification of teichoic acids
MHINVIVLNAGCDTVTAFMQSNKPMKSDEIEMQFNFSVVGIAGLLQPSFAILI